MVGIMQICLKESISPHIILSWLLVVGLLVSAKSAQLNLGLELSLEKACIFGSLAQVVPVQAIFGKITMWGFFSRGDR